MLALSCSECDRLWKDLSRVAQQSFRLEERLRHAQDRQDYDLVRALAIHLAELAGEHRRAQEALTEHEIIVHALPKKAAVATQ